MEKIELLFQAATLWLVSFLSFGELPEFFDMATPGYFGWAVWTVSICGLYLVPAYVLWRFTEDVRERVWRRWLEYVGNR